MAEHRAIAEPVTGSDRQREMALSPSLPGRHAGLEGGQEDSRRDALEFTAFPTVLLVTTLYRLALNIASTRLILGHGHEGVHGAGHVIEAFGPQRCMFESNFPVDRLSLSYRTFWNAAKKMVADLGEGDKDAMFRGTAARVYSL